MDDRYFPLAAEAEAMVPGAGRHIHALLGCDWGRHVMCPDDIGVCWEQAVRVMVVHDNGEHHLHLCAHHFDKLMDITTPHVDDP